MFRFDQVLYLYIYIRKKKKDKNKIRACRERVLCVSTEQYNNYMAYVMRIALQLVYGTCHARAIYCNGPKVRMIFLHVRCNTTNESGSNWCTWVHGLMMTKYILNYAKLSWERIRPIVMRFTFSLSFFLCPSHVHSFTFFFFSFDLNVSTIWSTSYPAVVCIYCKVFFFLFHCFEPFT